MDVSTEGRTGLIGWSFGIMLQIVIFFAVAFGIDWTEDQVVWVVVVGIFLLLSTVSLPISAASDLSDDIPAIKALKQKKAEYKKLKIPHPHKGTILILFLLAPFTVGITWFLALYLASGNFIVKIPDDVASAAGLLELPSGREEKAHAVGEYISDLKNAESKDTASELKRWKELLDTEAITIEEYNRKKSTLLG